MANWGFTLLTDNHIYLNNNNTSWFKTVIAKEPSILNCISCGSCSATCSSGHFTELSMRKINVWLNRGEIEPIKNQITKCMLCGKCMLICPRNVNTRHIILILHQLMSKETTYSFQSDYDFKK